MSIDYHPNWNKLSRSGGYPAIHCPDHPRAWSTGWIHIHIIIAEQKLGRLLTDTEIVHHKDENKDNYAIDNLIIFASSAEHAAEHGKDKIVNYVDLICEECGKQFVRRLGQEPKKKGYKSAFCSRSCNGKTQRRMQQMNGLGVIKPKTVRHGTVVGYGYHKCRCQICKDAHNARMRAHRQQHKVP